LEFKDVRLNNLKGVSLEVMAVVREWFDLQGETNQDIGSNRKDYSHPKTAISEKYSGATTLRKKLLGSMEKIF
jgi:hypothetical protein